MNDGAVKGYDQERVKIFTGHTARLLVSESTGKVPPELVTI